MGEIELKVSNYKEFMRFLGLFSLLRQTCQMVITKGGMELFGKFSSGRCDLYSSALQISNVSVDAPEKATMFLADTSKFIHILEMLEKYYSLDESNTPFETGEIRFFLGGDSSYFRIASAKYTIKFQLASNAVVRNSIGDESGYSLKPGKYSGMAHELFTGGKDILNEMDFLVAFRTDAKQIANVSSLISSLSNSDDAKIRFETPKQLAQEKDMSADGASVMVTDNFMYAVLSDNQKLIASKLGNKACASIGKITKSASECDEIGTDSQKGNFVYLMSPDQLKVLSSLISAFCPKAKAKKGGKKAAEAKQQELIPAEEPTEKCIEIGISKVNLMHVNLVSQTEQGVASELYVSLVGRNPD